MKRDQFTFYRSYYEALKHLPKRDQTSVLMAVISYALDEEEPSLSGVPLSVFTLIRPTLDSGRNKAKNRINKTEQNENKKEQTRKEKEREKEVEGEIEIERENDSYTPPTPSSRGNRFVSPSLDQVRAYCLERGNKVDPQSFVDFYASKGWVVGKSPMKDWKAAVRTWERKEREPELAEKEDRYANVLV